MIDKKVESIDEYLDRELSGKKTKVKNDVKKSDKKEDNKKSGLVVKIVAAVLVLTTAITGLFMTLGKNKKAKTKGNTNKDSITSTIGLNDMGDELNFPNEDNINKPTYGNTTGNIDISKIVTVVDPVTGKTIILKDEQAKQNYNNIGKVETDTKGGTLSVDSNGKVKENGQGHQVDNGTIGSGSAPAGKVWDSEVKAYVDPSEVGKYVILTKDYKDPATGQVVLTKGSLVEKTTLSRLEAYIKNYNSQSTTSQSTQSTTESKPKTETQQTGRYTVNGLTFESKADYEQWVIQGYEGYDLVDGIMMSEQARLEYQKSLNR